MYGSIASHQAIEQDSSIAGDAPIRATCDSSGSRIADAARRSRPGNRRTLLPHSVRAKRRRRRPAVQLALPPRPPLQWREDRLGVVGSKAPMDSTAHRRECLAASFKLSVAELRRLRILLPATLTPRPQSERSSCCELQRFGGVLTRLETGPRSARVGWERSTALTT